VHPLGALFCYNRGEVFRYPAMLYRHAFVEVIKELFGVTHQSSIAEGAASSHAPLSLPAPVQSSGLSETTVGSYDFSGQAALGTHTEAFICVPEARVFLRPVHAFDSVLRVLPYGSVVTVHRHEGRFSAVEYAGSIGWVHKDELVYKSESIFPTFVVGEFYDARHTTTEAIRRYLHDEFFTESLFLPLLSVEYVSYVLLRKGRIIPWSTTRPRRAGTWHILLRGARGVHIGLSPHTGAVIEYNLPEGESVVGYVESVRPDGTVTVATVGRTTEGMFERYELTEAEYREVRALFISLT
jgi:hypothetical protein